MSAIEDLYASIRDAAKERFSTPIGGYIVLAWLAWNHKLIMALLFADSLNTRYIILSELYPDSKSIFWMWVAYPVLTGMAILVTIPILHFVVSLWQHYINALLKRAQHSIKSPDIIPIEKIKAFEEKMNSLSREYEIQLDSLHRKVSELNNANTELRTEKSSLQSNIQKLGERINALSAKNGELSATEKNILLKLGEANTFSVSDADAMMASKLNALDYNLYRKRLHEDLHLIHPNKADHIQLTKDGVSAVVKLKETLTKQ